MTTPPAGESPDAAATQPQLPPEPFAPVPRAPRVPWINPARRGHVVATSIGAALVVLGAGIGIGWAVAPTHHRDHFFRFGPGMYPAKYFPGGAVLLPGQRRIYFPPRVLYPPWPTPSSVPTPSPSSS